ncbi:hypothetical protein FIBSPDRAFT_894348 [Athelia psychrophila]|uniref:Uncharacterized protein n=1 Tax=Athelia psychrophila TaxID=1759441 RepID=A0A166G3F5_9AGAM|nr:hypothetical protein FIBSPDRAFT_894348 [Fibularhizoctonia sp. CBS 109695]
MPGDGGGDIPRIAFLGIATIVAPWIFSFALLRVLNPSHVAPLHHRHIGFVFIIPHSVVQAFAVQYTWATSQAFSVYAHAIIMQKPYSPPFVTSGVRKVTRQRGASIGAKAPSLISVIETVEVSGVAAPTPYGNGLVSLPSSVSTICSDRHIRSPSMTSLAPSTSGAQPSKTRMPKERLNRAKRRDVAPLTDTIEDAQDSMDDMPIPKFGPVDLSLKSKHPAVRVDSPLPNQMNDSQDSLGDMTFPNFGRPDLTFKGEQPVPDASLLPNPMEDAQDSMEDLSLPKFGRPDLTLKCKHPAVRDDSLSPAQMNDGQDSLNDLMFPNFGRLYLALNSEHPAGARVQNDRQAASSAADKTIPADVKSAAGITYPADIGTGVEAEADVEQQRMDQLAINSAGDEEVARANDDPIDCHSDEETYASPSLSVLDSAIAHEIDAAPRFCKPSVGVPAATKDLKKEYTALWQHELALATHFAHGRYDQADAKSFASVRKAMARGLQPLSEYGLTVLRIMEDDLAEESKIRREGVATLEAVARFAQDAEQAYGRLVDNISNGLY